MIFYIITGYMEEGFLYWLFVKKDVDSLIVALIVSAAVSGFIDDFTTAFITPITSAILPTRKDDKQHFLGVGFQFQFLFSGMIKFAINILIAYILVAYLMKFLPAAKKLKKKN